MNAVPIEYWTVLERKKHIVTAYNYQNNQEVFDDFAYTGLNNFDFFATKFYKSGLEEVSKIEEK